MAAQQRGAAATARTLAWWLAVGVLFGTGAWIGIGLPLPFAVVSQFPVALVALAGALALVLIDALRHRSA